MKKNWSKTWNSSTQPRKQRKYRFKAPLHVKQKFMTVSLSQELRKKTGTRNAIVRVGDKVKVLRGQFRKKTGKVMETDLKKSKVVVEGIEQIKKDGSKATYPLNPTNLMITELNLEDKKRKLKLSIKTEKNAENKSKTKNQKE